MSLKSDVREKGSDGDLGSNLLRHYKQSYDESWESEYDSDDI